MTLFHYVNVPVVEMRAQPDKSSEVISQAFYSEQVRIVEKNSAWIKIETTVDQYQGWSDSKALFPRTSRFLSDSESIPAKVDRCSAHLYAVPDTIYGPLLTLPFESRLEVLEPIEESNSRWLKVLLVDGREGFIQRGDVTLNMGHITRSEICSFSMRFSGLPYTWGGRSSFGYDCSGFVQMLYRQMGLYLPRDAKDQIHWEGFKAIPVKDLKSSDLIFFGSKTGVIGHVGMFMGNDQFIHATVSENSPYIHTSSLSAPLWNGSEKWPYMTACALRS